MTWEVFYVWENAGIWAPWNHSWASQTAQLLKQKKKKKKENPPANIRRHQGREFNPWGQVDPLGKGMKHFLWCAPQLFSRAKEDFSTLNPLRVHSQGSSEMELYLARINKHAWNSHQPLQTSRSEQGLPKGNTMMKIQSEKSKKQKKNKTGFGPR